MTCIDNREAKMSDYLFELKQIVKRFNGVTVLDNVNFAVRPGEIKGLVGNNGSGKTLIAKIFSGADIAYSGSIYIDGKKEAIWNPRDARLFGIEAIYQESNLVSNLSVGENIFIGNMPITGKWFKRIDWKTVHAKAKAVLGEINADISPRDIVSKLPLGRQRIVEIAKAISQNARLIVFDES
jgi:ABC-type sugar transport system ATPase subunit